MNGRLSYRAFWMTAIEGIDTDLVARELGLTTTAVRQACYRVGTGSGQSCGRPELGCPEFDLWLSGSFAVLRVMPPCS